MTSVLAVAAGSALGGVGRYLVTLGLAPRAATFPVGTLVVNIIGGLAIGVLARTYVHDQAPGVASSSAWLFLAVGLCGGFTTFSAFGLDTVRLLQGGSTGRAALYVAASVGLTMTAVYAGLLAGRVFARG